MRSLKLVVTLGLAAGGASTRSGPQLWTMTVAQGDLRRRCFDDHRRGPKSRPRRQEADAATRSDTQARDAGDDDAVSGCRPKMLDALEPTEKVRFKADRIRGQITVTALETAE